MDEYLDELLSEGEGAPAARGGPSSATEPPDDKASAPQETSQASAIVEETKEPSKKVNPILGIVFPVMGQTTVVMVQPSEERDLKTSPSEAKKLLQSDEMPGTGVMLKLARRISTSFDGKVFTMVSYDRRGDSRADMGCVNMSDFRTEMERNRVRGAYIISTIGPPFGKGVEVVSVGVKSSFMEKIRKTA